MANPNPPKPYGNNNAAKAKIWSDAVRKAMLSGKKVDKIAHKLIQMAEDGDITAIKEIGDRLEGKPKQSIDANINTHDVTIDQLG